MNKFELEELAAIRIKEAEVLLNAGCFHGAYYLAGYALECALKACICKRVQAYDFPDKQLTNDSYSHDLNKLLVTSDLKENLEIKEKEDNQFRLNWMLAKSWSESYRYMKIWLRPCLMPLLTQIQEC